jgi:hypothetical protein
MKRYPSLALAIPGRIIARETKTPEINPGEAQWFICPFVGLSAVTRANMAKEIFVSAALDTGGYRRDNSRKAQEINTVYSFFISCGVIRGSIFRVRLISGRAIFTGIFPRRLTGWPST